MKHYTQNIFHFLLTLGCAMAGARGQQSIARNLDKVLDEEISVDWKGVPLEKAIADLREQTRTNIVVNWGALGNVSIARAAPLTLRLKNVPYEAVARSILLVLAPREAGLNYVVGDNALEITTDADLAKSAAERIIDVTPLIARGASAEQLKGILHEALVLACERVDGPGQALVIKDGLLVAKLSQRGQAIVAKTLAMCQSPLKIGPRIASVPGTAESVRAKNAAAAIRGIPLEKIVAGTIGVNRLLLPGAAHAQTTLDYIIDDAGIIEIGSPAEIGASALPGAYDLGDLVKRGNADVLVAEIKRALPVTATLTLFGHTLILFAPASVHRQVALKLQKMYSSSTK